MEAFIRVNAHHMAIAKLRLSKSLTPTDMKKLERFVFEALEVGCHDRFLESCGNNPLPQLIRALVGMDHAAAQQAFRASYTKVATAFGRLVSLK